MMMSLFQKDWKVIEHQKVKDLSFLGVKSKFLASFSDLRFQAGVKPVVINEVCVL